MQSVDYTTLMAVTAELNRDWIPSRIEQVYQRDRFTISLALRTLTARSWLTISWHPEAARIHLGDAPPKVKDTFSFSDQLRHQLNGLALIEIGAIAPWERVLDLQFARRPGESALWHLYVEIMGKYSNVILTDANNQIVTPARQIDRSNSSVRTVQTGKPYETPPTLTGTVPKLEETYERWQERVSLIPGRLKRQLINSYRGLSPQVAAEIIQAAAIPDRVTDSLSQADWQQLFIYWQQWLEILATEKFTPGWLNDGYTVLGWQKTQEVGNVGVLLNSYYGDRLTRQQFQQLHHQLSQKLNNIIDKLERKANTFRQRLQQSEAAEMYRQQADLLMAHLHQWQPGMKSITLADFVTGKAIELPLNPEKNAVQNAQAFYKQHQKLKRAKDAVFPLLREVEAEINYLTQIKIALDRLNENSHGKDLEALKEIREELSEQQYLTTERKEDERTSDRDSQPLRYLTPSGIELWIGKNNRQNDILTFRTAVDYDLWFHTQEIPGSHVLLRLNPGDVPEARDLQLAADFAAYYSRASQSDTVPVIYTKPQHVYKPKGAKPGMVIYKQETVIWGRPQSAREYISEKGDRRQHFDK
jgi:predicted ribosome quality control (RQC) complex YloA/Tae2 family protein